MKELASEPGNRFSEFDMEEVDGVEGFISPTPLASWAANVESTADIINCEELEAVSLSATSAAILAVDFFGVALESTVVVDGFESYTRSSSKRFFRTLEDSSTCANATWKSANAF